MPLDDSLMLCTRDLVIIIRGQGNDTLKGHVLPVLLPNTVLQGRELDTEELMVPIHPLNGEHGTFGPISNMGKSKVKSKKLHFFQD